MPSIRSPTASLRKHRLSPFGSADSPPAQKRRMGYEKPYLRIDCSQPPGPTPQLMIPPQPWQFPFEPRMPASFASGLTPIRHQCQSHVQQTAAYPGWGTYSESVQHQWANGSVPFTMSPEFLETGRTSSTSQYSFHSIGQNPFQSSPAMAAVAEEHVVAGSLDCLRDSSIADAIARLVRIKRVLIAEIEGIESMLEAKARSLGYGSSLSETYV
ncbi:hypothetical protein BS50DRAFT_261479 [Corynespora cassiicola Philippines]|uniref:Uncharacterized protein n=1 Tax=Corynespora cassiicola Philippines TaxID=1448308 RepID=A0A2T2N142_CORCC|nr:hypothetical protein BS50DRAFT_261479 [Corynespora cassiicola Philippines]